MASSIEAVESVGTAEVQPVAMSQIYCEPGGDLSNYRAQETKRLEEKLGGGKLYDREKEEQALVAAYRRTLLNRTDRELVLISGPSGTGKSALGNSMKKHVEADGGIFVSGKFDRLQRPEPYTAFVAAFTKFVHLQLERGEEDTAALKIKIKDAVESEAHILTDLIPALEQIMGAQDDVSVAKGAEARKRLQIVLRHFIAAVCSPQRPLVLFLDDLQWADPGSLDLLKAIATDTGTRGFMLLGACRSDDVTPSHLLSVVLRELEDESVAITSITVSKLDSKVVNDMLVDILCRPAADTESLAKIVCQCTDGNVLFVVQFLRLLFEEGLLRLDKERTEWEWDEELIVSRSDCQDVVQLVANKISRLTENVQLVLKIASCIGAYFDEYLLHDIVSSDLAYALSIAEDKGLIVFEDACGNCRFAHDTIQLAAYSLIPEDERATFHLSLGRKLWNTLTADELDLHVFLVVNQLSMGVDLMDDPDEHNNMAFLCLAAGERATQASAFAAAAEYIDLGIRLLSRRHWRDQYDLSLALYNAAAEVAYCNAQFERVDFVIGEVIANARCFRDQLRAYTTKVYSLGTQNEPQRAIATGLEVLDQLGQSIPANVTVCRMIWEFLKTRRMLHGKSEDQILSLPLMEDTDLLSAMRMMSIIYLHAFDCRPPMAPFIACRIIQLSLRHGMSGISSLGLSVYGMFLSGMFLKFDEAYVYGQLSLRLLDRFTGREWLPRTYSAVYGVINVYKDPLRDCLEPLRQGHRAGLATGDIEVRTVGLFSALFPSHSHLPLFFLQFAMVNAALYANACIHAGKPLTIVDREIKSFYDLMVTYKQDLALTYMKVMLQYVANWMGLAKNCLILTGDVVDQAAELEKAAKRKNVTVTVAYRMYQLILAYTMNEYHLAIDVMKLYHRECNQNTGPAFANIIICFYEALTALALAPISRKRHYKTKARRKLKSLRKFAACGPSNCRNKVLLVEAELRFRG